MLCRKILFLILVHLSLGRHLESDVRGRSPHVSPDLKIINGHDAAPHAAPYFAHVILLINGKMNFCGGSLIHEQFVLTAAHCLTTPGTAVHSVVLGLHSANQTDPIQRVQASDFRYHENFTADRLPRHDIGIIKLEKPVTTASGRVETVELPVAATFPAKQNAYDNADVTLYGWGRTRQNPKELPDALQTLDGKVLPYSQCYNMASVRKDELCVGRRDGRPGLVCLGDSGGPVVQGGLLVGVHSKRSVPLCSASLAALYARVDYHVDWIKEKIQALK